MFTVTFYSYKGGVGRSSALMNVASRLCSVGKRVCLLDFDLEAPGLDSFGMPHPATPMAGVVEYISEFLETGGIPNFRDYIYEITGKNRGALYLVPAGKKDASYQHKVSQLDWKFLYRQKNGSLIIEALRRVIARDLQIDYFLIDSRTGLTDVAGITTLQLPDLVVMLFNLNDQNINGTAQVYKSIRDNRLNRPIKTLLVASPIPEIPEFVQLRSNRFQRAKEAIGSPADMIIPYDPWICFQEAIVDSNQSRPLSSAYDTLATRIISLNEKDVLNLIKEAREFLEVGEMKLADLKYKEALGLYPNSGEAWFQYGRFARIKGDYSFALELLHKAVELLAVNDMALGELALTQLEVGDISSAKEAYLRLVESSDDVNLLTRLSRILAEKGEPELALKGMDRVIERNPTAELRQVRWEQAETLLKTAHYEAAGKIFSDLAQASSQGLPVTFNAGYAAWKAEDKSWKDFFLRAIAMFEASDLNKLLPKDSANIHSAIAFAYKVLDQPDKARAALLKALQLAEREDDSALIFSFPEYLYLQKDKFIEGVAARLSKIGF